MKAFVVGGEGLLQSLNGAPCVLLLQGGEYSQGFIHIRPDRGGGVYLEILQLRGS
jgi:hypothetical protein